MSADNVTPIRRGVFSSPTLAEYAALVATPERLAQMEADLRAAERLGTVVRLYRQGSPEAVALEARFAAVVDSAKSLAALVTPTGEQLAQQRELTDAIEALAGASDH